MKQKIFLLDDHPMVINGIAEFLSTISDVEVVGICTDPQVAVKSIEEAAPDLLIFDYQLPGTTGMDLFCKVRSVFPSLKGICYTQHCEAWIVQSILKAKVNGIVLKSEDPEILASAVDAVLLGEEFFSPIIMKVVCSTYTKPRSFNLTNREVEVLRLIAEERSSKEIADCLCLSVATVEDYRKNLLMKMEVRNMAGLVLKASKMGIL